MCLVPDASARSDGTSSDRACCSAWAAVQQVGAFLGPWDDGPGEEVGRGAGEVAGQRRGELAVVESATAGFEPGLAAYPGGRHRPRAPVEPLDVDADATAGRDRHSHEEPAVCDRCCDPGSEDAGRPVPTPAARAGPVEFDLLWCLPLKAGNSGAEQCRADEVPRTIGVDAEALVARALPLVQPVQEGRIGIGGRGEPHLDGPVRPTVHSRKA